MNQLTVVLVLVLASTNASKFLPPLHEFQQDPITREISDDSIYSEYNDQRFPTFLPKLTSDLNELEGWASITDLRPYYVSDTFENTYAKPDDLRTKRTDPSLSIVNALDVLRQQMMLEFARRKMNESKAQIQRNRELLIKTGKRSHRYLDDSVRFGMQQYLLRKRLQNEDLDRGEVAKTMENSTTRNKNELGYQT